MAIGCFKQGKGWPAREEAAEAPAPDAGSRVPYPSGAVWTGGRGRACGGGSSAISRAPSYWRAYAPNCPRPNLTEGPILQALLTLALPIVFGNLLQTAYQLVDAYWVGKLGTGAVAAVAVSLPINFLLIALGSGFSVAGSTLVAQNIGGRNLPRARQTANYAIGLGFAGLLLGGAGWLAPRPE